MSVVTGQLVNQWGSSHPCRTLFTVSRHGFSMPFASSLRRRLPWGLDISLFVTSIASVLVPKSSVAGSVGSGSPLEDYTLRQ